MSLVKTKIVFGDWDYKVEVPFTEWNVLFRSQEEVLENTISRGVLREVSKG